MVVPAARGSGTSLRERSRFVGRARELDELAHLVAAHRVVTITGPAGIGKTRLAHRFATLARFEYQSAGGVWFADLSGTGDVEAMARAVLRALRIGDEATATGPDAVSAVGRALAARRKSLFVLDNVEQLGPSFASAVAAWLDAAPAARFITTSRDVLALSGESVQSLAPLPVPAAGSCEGDAVELFLDRMRAQRREWSPGDVDLDEISAIVRHLLGVPLAIEIAASRLAGDPAQRVLPRSAVASLAGGVHRSLRPETTRQAVDWAFGLLSPAEREVLAHCSVFRGGFGEDAAAAVVVSTGRSGATLRELLESLASRGLLERDGATASAGGLRLAASETAPMRLRMCEGIRQRAAEELVSTRDDAGALRRHARHFAERSRALLAGAAPRKADVASLAPDRDNLALALETCASACRDGGPNPLSEAAVLVAVALDALSAGSGLTRAQLADLDAALSLGVRGAQERADRPFYDVALFGRALGVRAAALRAVGRLHEAERDAEMALALAREATDWHQEAAMHMAVGMARFQLGRIDRALGNYELALELWRAAGDRGNEAQALQQLGAVHQTLGHTAAALSHYEDALELAVATRDGPGEARAAMGLGSYHLECGDHARARTFYERGFYLAKHHDMHRALRIVTGYLGVLAFDEGLLGEAERFLESATVSSRSVGDLRVEGVFDGVRGAVLAAMGRVTRRGAASRRPSACSRATRSSAPSSPCIAATSTSPRRVSRARIGACPRLWSTRPPPVAGSKPRARATGPRPPWSSAPTTRASP